jgi:hypothetical protein
MEVNDNDPEDLELSYTDFHQLEEEEQEAIIADIFFKEAGVKVTFVD